MRKTIWFVFAALVFSPLWPAEIHEAVKKGNLAGVQAMLEKDPGLLNARDDQGLTPLLTAVAFRQEKVFKFLPASGADVGLASGGTRIAIVTFVSSPDQERLVKAMIRSIRERGGGDRESLIFVVTADAENLPCKSLTQDGVVVLPLEMERAFLDYPLALKAYAAAQVENKVKESAGTLVWLDPGVLVLKPLEALALGDGFDAAVRPVTLANTIAMAPQAAPNDYWQPIYKETRLDYAGLPVLKTITDGQEIQPYYNCEVFSFNPRLGIAGEWARLLTRLLKDEKYQKSACTTFLRKLFLHQAVLSAVITSRIKPERIKALPLTSGYPFSQHERLPEGKKAACLEGISVAIFDRSWQQDPDWLNRVPAGAPLRSWLAAVYGDYLASGAKKEE